MKEALSEADSPYVAVDISSVMLPLMHFLAYIDTRPEFEEIKEAGRVGLPCIVVDKGEKIYFGLPEDLDELR